MHRTWRPQRCPNRFVSAAMSLWRSIVAIRSTCRHLPTCLMLKRLHGCTRTASRTTLSPFRSETFLRATWQLYANTLSAQSGDSTPGHLSPAGAPAPTIIPWKVFVAPRSPNSTIGLPVLSYVDPSPEGPSNLSAADRPPVTRQAGTERGIDQTASTDGIASPTISIPLPGLRPCRSCACNDCKQCQGEPSRHSTLPILALTAIWQYVLSLPHLRRSCCPAGDRGATVGSLRGINPVHNAGCPPPTCPPKEVPQRLISVNFHARGGRQANDLSRRVATWIGNPRRSSALLHGPAPAARPRRAAYASFAGFRWYSCDMGF